MPFLRANPEIPWSLPALRTVHLDRRRPEEPGESQGLPLLADLHQTCSRKDQEMGGFILRLELTILTARIAAVR